jgi:hypothetical protein
MEYTICCMSECYWAGPSWSGLVAYCHVCSWRWECFDCSTDKLEQSFSDLNIDDNRGGQHIFEHSETGEIPSNDNDTTIDYFDQEYWHANYT